MEGDEERLVLLEMLFGEAAEKVRSGASERLLGWCRAFDEWLAERQLLYKAGIKRTSVPAWRRLLKQCPKMPWELGPADIEGHAAWMREEGYSPSTIHISIGIISNFYRWCGERGIDPECGPGFDPAAKAPRPAIKRWDGAKLLSPAEVEALLGILRRDPSPVGMRDYAFFLSRLRTGVPLAALRCLQWGQIEAGGEGARVRWRPEGQPTLLAEDAWEAIQAYLAASGRLAGMRADSYLFAPTVQHFTETAGSKAEDWREGSPITREPLRTSLKLYGRLAGIPEEKLTLRALRNTAIRLRLDAGEGLEGMQAFLGREGDLSQTKYQLGRMPGREEGEDRGLGEEGSRGAATGELRSENVAGEDEPRVPSRRGRLLKADEHIQHGLYAQSLPSEEVLAVLAEDIQGLEEQICGLRTLARGLLFRQEEGCPSSSAARAIEAYSLAAARLAELIKVEKKLEEGDKEAREWEADIHAGIQETFLYLGELQVSGETPVSREPPVSGDPLVSGDPPVSRVTQEEKTEVKPELPANARRTVEEAAALRYMLRRTLHLAMEAQEMEAYIRLVEVYGRASTRLARLLAAEGSTQSQFKESMKQAIEQALRDVTEEMGLTR